MKEFEMCCIEVNAAGVCDGAELQASLLSGSSLFVFSGAEFH